jgi:phage protein D
MPQRRPYFTVKYGDQKLTSAVPDANLEFISLSFRDSIDDKSDELSLSIVDTTGVWRESLYPVQGEVFSVVFGWSVDGQPIEVQEREGTISDIDSDLQTEFNLRATGTPVLKGLRTRHDRTWENITLRDLFAEFADRYKLELVGTIEDIKLERLTQENQTDIEFLSTEAAKHDHLFKIEDGQRLVVFTQKELDEAPTQFSIAPTDWIGVPDYSDKLDDVYGACRVTCENPDTDESIAYLVTASGLPDGETFEITEQGIDSGEQAITRAESALREKNADKITLRLTLLGSSIYQAGINFDLTGCGVVIDGIYQIKEVDHSLNAQGYESRLSCRKIIDLGKLTVTREI